MSNSILKSWGYGRKKYTRTRKYDKNGNTTVTSWSGTNEPYDPSMHNPTSMDVGGCDYSSVSTGGGVNWSSYKDTVYTNFPYFIFDIPSITSGRSIKIPFKSNYDHSVELRRITSQFNGVGKPETSSVNAVSSTIPKSSTIKTISFDISRILDDIKNSGNNYGVAIITSAETTDKGTTISNVGSSVTFDDGWVVATVPTFNPSTVTLGNSTTISLIADNPGNITHSLSWEINGNTGVIATKTSSPNVTFTPTVAQFAQYITNSTSARLKIICDTYVDNELTGTTETYITINIPSNSSTRPVASIVSIVDSSVVPNHQNYSCYGFFGAYVFGKSIIDITVGFEGKYNATIRNYSLTLNGKTYSFDVSSGTTHKFETGVIDVYSEERDVEYSVTVTDSRGISSSVVSGSIPCIPYAHSPSISNVSVERAKNLGDTDEDVTVSYTVDICRMSVNGIDKNDKILIVKRKLKAASGFGTVDTVTIGDYSGNGTFVSSGVYSVESTYVLRIYAKDAFTQSYVNIELPSASAKIIDIAPNGNIAFNMEHPGDDKTHFERDVVMNRGLDIGGDENVTGTATFYSYVNLKNGDTTPRLWFTKSADDSNCAALYVGSDNRFFFREKHAAAEDATYDNYRLPPVSSGDTSNHTYDIMTTKDHGTFVYTANVTTSGWTSDGGAGFSKTVSVSGLLSSDNPIVDITNSSTYPINENRIDAYSYVSYIENNNNSITLHCVNGKPSYAFTLKILVVR